MHEEETTQCSEMNTHPGKKTSGTESLGQENDMLANNNV